MSSAVASFVGNFVATDAGLLDPPYPGRVFVFKQLVEQGWITINDLTAKFYSDGLVIVRMNPYISKPMNIRFTFILQTSSGSPLVTNIVPPDFSLGQYDDVYVPGLVSRHFDQRCPSKLAEATQLEVSWQIWG